MDINKAFRRETTITPKIFDKYESRKDYKLLSTVQKNGTSWIVLTYVKNDKRWSLLKKIKAVLVSIPLFTLLLPSVQNLWKKALYGKVVVVTKEDPTFKPIPVAIPIPNPVNPPVNPPAAPTANPIPADEKKPVEEKKTVSSEPAEAEEGQNIRNANSQDALHSMAMMRVQDTFKLVDELNPENEMDEKERRNKVQSLNLCVMGLYQYLNMSVLNEDEKRNVETVRSVAIEIRDSHDLISKKIDLLAAIKNKQLGDEGKKFIEALNNPVVEKIFKEDESKQAILKLYEETLELPDGASKEELLDGLKKFMEKHKIATE